MPDISPDEDYAKQRAYYEKKFGIIFLDDEWSLWHIRVWIYAREANGFGMTINADVVFRYAKKFDMDDIDTLERIKNIDRGVSDGK